ncbi:MAG: transglutaminase-like cysteine peptidase [Devosia sp.]
MYNTIRMAIGGALVFFALQSPSIADTIDFANPAFAPVTGPTSVPVGHAEFCKIHHAECRPNGHVVEVEALTDVRWQQLVTVNDQINSTILPETDEELYQVAEYWTYPDGRGDCEDFVLAKRRALIEMGWDTSAVLMTVVREANGAGHAVLMVRTDRGDLVLDNQDGRILVWTDTPYQFIKRQSQSDAGKWVGIADSHAELITASR